MSPRPYKAFNDFETFDGHIPFQRPSLSSSNASSSGSGSGSRPSSSSSTKERMGLPETEQLLESHPQHRHSFHAYRAFPSSPLNPSTTSPYGKAFNSLGRATITRLPSEDARVLGHRPRTGSMILYRLVDVDSINDPPTPPPHIPFGGDHRRSASISPTGSVSDSSSLVSVSDDSKYPSGSLSASQRGMVAYAYDPALDEVEVGTDDEWAKEEDRWSPRNLATRRGLYNVGFLVLLLLLIIALATALPLADHAEEHRNWLILHNPFINSTGQAQVFIPATRRSEAVLMKSSLNGIDPATPLSVYTAMEHELIRSWEYSIPAGTKKSCNLGYVCLGNDDFVDIRFRLPERHRAIWYQGQWKIAADSANIEADLNVLHSEAPSQAVHVIDLDGWCLGHELEYIRVYRQTDVPIQSDLCQT